ncbi:MAG TPA: hypothetical protein VD902_12705 [Symbiobacteriaceae bacterium]|nr:hypothetical protein [Symbiobacteriaceae bacterium]
MGFFTTFWGAFVLIVLASAVVYVALSVNGKTPDPAGGHGHDDHGHGDDKHGAHAHH